MSLAFDPESPGIIAVTGTQMVAKSMRSLRPIQYLLGGLWLFQALLLPLRSQQWMRQKGFLFAQDHSLGGSSRIKKAESKKAINQDSARIKRRECARRWPGGDLRLGG